MPFDLSLSTDASNQFIVMEILLRSFKPLQVVVVVLVTVDDNFVMDDKSTVLLTGMALLGFNKFSRFIDVSCCRLLAITC